MARSYPRFPWNAGRSRRRCYPLASPDGRIGSFPGQKAGLGLQSWHVRNKYVSVPAPAERVLDLSYVEAAAQGLPPFVVENADSKLAGCR